jgi:hypothetical protein
VYAFCRSRVENCNAFNGNRSPAPVLIPAPPAVADSDPRIQAEVISAKRNLRPLEKIDIPNDPDTHISMDTSALSIPSPLRPWHVLALQINAERPARESPLFANPFRYISGCKMRHFQAIGDLIGKE